MSYPIPSLNDTMANVPAPVMQEILSRLPVKSLVRFRCVSKSWMSLINSQYFINQHLQHSLHNTTNRSILLTSGSCLYSVDFPALEPVVKINVPLKTPYHETDELLGYCNGLLCLSLYCASPPCIDYIIFNPATRKHRDLPAVEFATCFLEPDERRVYGFGYDHVHDDYKLVTIIQFTVFDRRTEVQVYSLKSNSWEPILDDFPCEYSFHGTVGRSAVYLNGCLHWVVEGITSSSDWSKLIMVFDLGSEEYRILPLPEECETNRVDVMVGFLQGSLYAMYEYPTERSDVWIMKEYGVKESWTKVFSVAHQKDRPPTTYVTPIAYSNDGSQVLLGYCSNSLVWFDVQREGFNSAKLLNLHCINSMGKELMMVDSLVPLDSHEEQDENEA